VTDVLIPLLASLLVFVAIVTIGLLVQRFRTQAAKRRSLAMVSGYATNSVHEAIVKAEQENDSIVRMLILDLGKRMVGTKRQEKLAVAATRAGDTRADAIDKTLINKVVYMLIGALLGFLLGIASGGLAWLTLPAFAVLGFFAPDLILYNRGTKRDLEMAKRLPDALDLLNLCVESGLSFQAALGQVATSQEGPVAEEFAFALQEMQYGRSRGQALAAMAGRTRQEDVERFVSAMLQVDKLGVPVAVVLREQAKEMRAKRYSRAREQAMKVPVKILMPLMLCFLPALFIIILAPAAFSIAAVFSGQ